MWQYLREVSLGFWSILHSLWITLKHLFTPAVTVQYPTEKRRMPLRSLNRHALTIELETGKLKCTACNACAKICPTRCIEIVGAGKGKDRYPEEFWIDHNLCMYCNLCVEVCPFDAITMWTGDFELSGYHRRDLILDKSLMVAHGFYPTPMTPEPVAATAGGKGRAKR